MFDVFYVFAPSVSSYVDASEVTLTARQSRLQLLDVSTVANSTFCSFYFKRHSNLKKS